MKSARAFTQSFILLLAAHFLFVPARPSAQEDDSSIAEMEQRKQIAQHSTELLRAEKFEELEKIADEYRSSKARLPSGFWKLYNVYEGIESPRGSSGGREWELHLARLEKWRAQFPQSITVHTALVAAYVSYAWAARGGGYANTVTEEGWKLFRDRLRKAEEYVAAARKLPATDPQLDSVNLILAKGLSWDWEKYNAVFDEAVKREPEYMYLYFQKTNYSLPRWHGEAGDVERFATEAVKLSQDRIGKAMYARLAVYLRQYTERDAWLFDSFHLSWPQVREGFRDIEKQYPHSLWNLNQFCIVACQAKDAKTAHQLFEQIGDRWDSDVWGNEGQYRKWKNWAENPSAHSDYTTTRTEEEPSFLKRVLRRLMEW